MEDLRHQLFARSFPIVLLLFTSVITVRGQQGNLLFNHLGLKEGLSEASNLYVYKDRRGFVWISSVNGLNRFDGTSVKIYSPDPEDPCAMVGPNVQSSFFEDDSLHMWFNTHTAMNVYDWKSDCFHSYKIHIGQDSLVGYVSFYLDHHHNIWLLCDSYLYLFNIPTTSFKQIDKTDKPSIRAIAMQDSNGNVAHIWTYWLNHLGAEEFTLDAQHKVIDKKIVWDSSSSRPLVIMDMISQGDSVIWVLSPHSIWKYNVLTKEGRLFPFDKGNATSLEFRNDSTLLIGFKDKGLWEYDIPKAAFTIQYIHQPEDEFSLLSNTVDGITRDNSGELWISSWGKGLSYCQPKKTKFNTFFPKNINPVLQSFVPVDLDLDKPDVLMCATRSNGLYFFHRKGAGPPEITQVPKIDARSLPGNIANVIKDDIGNYWLLTHPGFSVFNPHSGEIKIISNKEDIAINGLPWRNHSMLFVGKGLFEATGNMHDGYTMSYNPALPDTINSMRIWMDTKGRLWLDKELTGFIILDGKDFRWLKTMPVTGFCTQMVERESSIWICSSDGLFEIDRDSLQVKKVHNKNNGLPVSGFNSMVMDLHQRLWLTFNEGIVMYDPSNNTVKNFTREDGLPPLQFTNVAYRFDDGEIWLAAIDGVTRFYPDQINDLDIQAIPAITEIQVNDQLPAEKLVCDLSGTTNIPLIQKLTFDYKRNTLAFRINALEFSAPQLNKVKYQMEGLEDHLVETTNGSLIRYTNLSPNHYRFVLYAANSDGIYNPEPRVLMINIRPPYYQTWWFRLLLFILSTGLLAYIIYLRFSKTLELQRVRLKLYENLHDDVGSRLTAIVLTAEDLERNQNIHNPKIESISKIAKSIVGNMRRLVWAIDPENDKMSNLIQKITHDKSLILDDTIAFKIQVDDHLKNVIVPGEIRYQIISICNEAFNNIVKYAKASSVIVTLSKENRNFRLTIVDNGIGFDLASTTKNAMTGSGYGLNNMKRRASRVKGTLDIFSKPGEGTRIVADFPY